MKTLLCSLILMALTTLGCNPVNLDPGRCNSMKDCTAPQVCTLETNDDTTRFRCVTLGLDAGLDSSVDGLTSDVLPVLDGGLDQAKPPECVMNTQCGDKLKPFCGADGKCRGCVAADCKGALPFCGGAGVCVACQASADCPSTNAPICNEGACIACNATAAALGACGRRDPGHAVCASTGQCVGCASSAQCPLTKPVCGLPSFECRACDADPTKGDAECVARGSAEPGVCMSHEDGRCASPAETVFVQNGDLQAAIDAAVAGGKKLVVVGENSGRGSFSGPGKLSLIGKGSSRPAVGAGPSKPGLSISGGEIYVRGISISGSAGGVLIDGAAFTFDDVDVSNNLVGSFSPTQKWGGIYVNNPKAPRRLTRITIQDNKASGLICTSAIEGTGVFASGNPVAEIESTCGIASCGSPSPTCGAQ